MGKKIYCHNCGKLIGQLKHSHDVPVAGFCSPTCNSNEKKPKENSNEKKS